MKRTFAVILVLVLGLIGLPQGAAGNADSPASLSSLPRLSGQIPIAEYDVDAWDARAAYNWKHQEYYVVWHNVDADGIRRIYGQRIDARTGEIIGAQPDPIAGGAQDKTEPDIDYDPVHDRYLVVWTHCPTPTTCDISGRFIPWEGSDPAYQEFKICSWGDSQSNAGVAYGRADEAFMVVFVHAASGVASSIGGMLVPADGSAINPKGGLTVATGPQDRLSPEIAWNRARNQFLVVYDIYIGGDWDVYGNLFSGTGTKDPTDILLGFTTDNENHGAVTSCAKEDQWLVTWEAKVGGDDDLKGILFGGDLSHIANLTISAYGGDQEYAQTSCNYNENGYMVTYQENIGGNTGISARPVSLDGSLGDGFQVQYAEASMGNNTPAIAGGRTNFLVVWQNSRPGGAHLDIYGRLLTPYTTYLPAMLRIP